MSDTPMTDTSMSIEQILAAFASDQGVYQREAVDEAIRQRDEIIPQLIRVLEQTLAAPTEPQGSTAHIYALMLLGRFREPAAHDPLIRLLSLPDDQAYPLFGDLITEDIPLILVRTSGGSTQRLKELILARQADAFCRNAGATALTYGVAEGLFDRQAVLEFLGSLFTGAEAEDAESPFWSLIASSILDLYPAELMPIIRRGFEQDLIDPMVVSLERFETTVATSSVDQALAELRVQIQRYDLDDLHATMERWAMFGVGDDLAWPLLPAPKVRTPDANAGKKAKKKKRQMAKASRKKTAAGRARQTLLLLLSFADMDRHGPTRLDKALLDHGIGHAHKAGDVSAHKIVACHLIFH
jgi:hypothetical protein